MRIVRVLAALAAGGAVASCSSGPCDDASADKAGAAFAQCLRLEQTGDGGYRCGRAAFDTHCKIRSDRH